MIITEQFVNEAGEALLKHCPLVSADSAASQRVREKILSYVEKLELLPSVELVVRFANPLEEQLKQEQEADQAAAQKEADRQARIDRDFHRPSSEDRKEALEEFKASQPQPIAREPFKPRKEFSEAEIDSMTSDEYAREILGVPDSDKNRSVGPPIEKKKAQTIKRQAYDGRRAQEEADIAVRRKQERLDAEQKKKLRKELKDALTKGKK
jgi:hypothetical protein